MNNEMKRIISRYLFRCVVITCVLCFCAGAVTVKQRSEYNSCFTSYAVMSVKNTGEAINVSVDDKSYSVDFGRIKDFAVYRKYLYFTPFSCVAFFFDSIYELFSSFKG